MATFTVQDIVRAAQGALVTGDLGVPVTGVSIDSRTIGVGDAFFAIRGHRLDGHAFLADAAGRGASCVVVHTLPDEAPANVPLVLVEDTTRALGRLGAWHRGKFQIPVVGVTGSNGKTTTKELVAGVLATRWNVLKPTSSFNNQWGLPLTLLALGPEHQAAVLELGSQSPGEIAYLTGLAQPTVGVVTTVAHSHIELLGSLDGVRDEKAALVRAIGAQGRADGEARAEAGGVAFTLAAGGGRVDVALTFAGRHNVTNALAAAAVGVALGIPLDEIARGLASARPVRGRCVWRMAGDVRILDDTYNANPVSVRAALATAGAARAADPATPRLVVVLADMLELGAVTADAHREVGRAVVEAGAAEFVGVGRHMQLATEAARAAGLAEVRHCAAFEDTVAHLLKRLAPGDIVLVKGSRSMRMERVVDALVARLHRTDGERPETG